MSNRVTLLLAVLWAVAIVVAAVLDAPPNFASLLPVIAAVTLLSDRRDCVRAQR